ncbi:MAG: hypothetical protein H7831_08215 [Magnetococcus sp. WYHC-3]
MSKRDKSLAYIIGVSLGDGNLSNPNKRAVRLRITCDKKYPKIIDRIKENLKIVLPYNKIGIVNKKSNCIDISCYSNQWPKLLGWRPDKGSKYKQNVRVPRWIFNKKIYIKNCLAGLIETDGSVYTDRGYKYINFTNKNIDLSKDVLNLFEQLGFRANFYKTENKNVVRLSKDVGDFLKKIKLSK